METHLQHFFMPAFDSSAGLPTAGDGSIPGSIRAIGNNVAAHGGA
jgi:hypothetical protein